MTRREKAARRICATLSEAGFRALFAGGCVRDMLLGQPPKDYDIATNARPEEVLALFPRTVAVGVSFGVVLVLAPEGNFEVATFRQDGPYLDGRRPSTVAYSEERYDALRRDFTINAMFFDPGNDSILDFAGGQEDLQNKRIRTVGDPRQRFEEDYLRLLRAVRFAARLNYTIEEKTLAALCELAPNIVRTSAERIRDELIRMLTESGAKRAFLLLDQTGLLAQVLPEVSAMKGIEQPPEFHPEGDVFQHTLLMLDCLEHPSTTLAMAALLHDVGKPVTQTFEDRIRFNYHDKAGAQMCREICRRLRFSKAEAEKIAWLVGHHMRLSMFERMGEAKRKRLARHEAFDELLALCRADCLASHGDLEGIEWIERYLASLPPERLTPPPLLTGHDLIEMGYVPGPIFGDILAAVEEAQLEGAIESPENARAFVEKRWPAP